MQEMINASFQRAWFGPFSIPRVQQGMNDFSKPAGQVYDMGPLDGLKTSSMWAQRMAQIPLRNYAQIGAPAPRAEVGGPVFCLPGHIPVPTGVPGQSKCVPYSAPSGMIGPQATPTVSTQVPPAYPTGRSFEVGPYYGWRKNGGLGQMQDPYFTLAERNKILFDYKVAMSYTKSIDDLLAWSGDNDPGLRVTLGPDSTRFSALTNSIAPLYPTVKEMMDRLSESDAEYWYRSSDEEMASLKQWLTGVAEMYKIVIAHRPQPLTLAPGMAAPPGFTNTTPATATQVIRVDQNGQQLPVSVAGGGNKLATRDILLGGGLALGLGLLIYAITS